MKRLFGYADRYIRESSWQDMGLMKLCLCAFGIMLGLNVPKRAKPLAFCGAVAVFWATAVPLMAKFIDVVIRMRAEEKEEEIELIGEE